MPTQWFDAFKITTRIVRDDKVVFFSFLNLPLDRDASGGEIARFATGPTHARLIIDVLCQSMDYYPERPATRNE